MNPDHEYIRMLLRTRAALALGEDKAYLIDSRLEPVFRREGYRALSELVTALRTQPFGDLHRKVVEALVTSETSFFRDIGPFETLRVSVLPELTERLATERRLSIWSAGCASGQEPYSIAMLIREHFPKLSGWTLSIHATDLSREMVERGRQGLFSQIEVNRGLPAHYLLKFFKKKDLNWEIDACLRQMICFNVLNLMERWPFAQPLDIIFLRNVLIYFDLNTRKTVLAQARRALRPNGYLFLGASETTSQLDDGFQCVQRDRTVCFRRG